MIVTDLDKLSDPVTHKGDDGHFEVAERLLGTLRDVGGYGLSANQIGVSGSRTCLVSVKEEVVLVNPKIVRREGTTQTVEGCLSIPNVEVQTERSLHVYVEADAWYKSDWNKDRLWELDGTLCFGPDEWPEHMERDSGWKQTQTDYLESIAVQHEIDHLNGKTIYDREIKNDPFEKSGLDKLGRNDKVYVENADGDEFKVKWKYAKKHEDWTVLDVLDT